LAPLFENIQNYIEGEFVEVFEPYQGSNTSFLVKPKMNK